RGGGDRDVLPGREPGTPALYRHDPPAAKGGIPPPGRRAPGALARRDDARVRRHRHLRENVALGAETRLRHPPAADRNRWGGISLLVARQPVRGVLRAGKDEKG